MRKIIALIITCLMILSILHAQETNRWSLQKNGSIKWNVTENESHIDHIEMSGLFISSVVHYGVEKGKLHQVIKLTFPMLRTIPNDTHASLMHEINYNELSPVTINEKPVVEYPYKFFHKGKLEYQSKTNAGLEIKHELFPSTDLPVFIDKISVLNTTNKTAVINIPDLKLNHQTEKNKGVYGSYNIDVSSDRSGSFSIKPNETIEYSIIYSGYKENKKLSYISSDYELKKREKLVDQTLNNLVLETPNIVLNRLFSFAKIRAVESIYHTKGGLMHGPGGMRYYAAIWANDQAEYANPFFPFLGNLEGNESAINSFRHFARYMNDEYEPIPSSIIAEGTSYWNGAGDRGDMAMIAYGASRFALSYGDKKTAADLWPLIEWCLEYCERKINKKGVVSSDTDELENRFPAGDANLNTSSLYYDALKSAVFLGKELNIGKKQLNEYQNQYEQIELSIEKYFGATVDGYETYQYFEGNNILRAWICTPLTVDIFNRSKGTIDALFSEKLWTNDGLASQAGNKTFWDRATLYALRGVFAAGETGEALKFLQHYSNRRLLGDHVPYPVEAYPEGNQRHLSAESALYCRIYTEGLFGIRPVGMNSFILSPKLPKDWKKMVLRNIQAFNKSFDIDVVDNDKNLMIKIYNKDKIYLSKKINKNESVKCNLD